jgi:hypothetical protein
MKIRISSVLASFVLILGRNTARSADLTWNGSISTDWNNASNWTPLLVPTGTDHVIINSGNVNIPANGAFAIMDWSGGSIFGSLAVASNAVLNLSGSAGLGLYGPLTNAGTVVVTSTGYLRPVYSSGGGYYGAIYNQAGGLIDIQNDQFVLWNYTGNEFFNNAGTLRKSAGTDTTSIDPQVNNTGTVDALTGTLSFDTSFTNVGGTLDFAVSGVSSFGQINVSGNVALNGTASVRWLGAFMPAVGDSFALLHYASHSGTFANITLPAGTVAQSNYAATVFSLLITAVNTQGDPPVLGIENANRTTASSFGRHPLQISVCRPAPTCPLEPGAISAVGYPM